MQEKKVKYIAKLPRLIFIYGIYAVICHIAMVILYCNYLITVQPVVIEKLFFQLFEYSIMSLVIVVLGGIVTNISIRQNKKA